MPYCKKCGKQLEEGARFCATCGSPVDTHLAQSRGERVHAENRKGSGISGEIGKIVAVAVIAIIAIALVVGLLPTIFRTGRQIGETINPPNVIVTSKNCRTGNVGLDYVAWVDVSVHNDGGLGTVVVWAEVTQGSSSWKKSMSVYLDSQGSRDLTFTFNEVQFWTTQQIYYRVWVE